jgi:Helix-hairpin-helix motif
VTKYLTILFLVLFPAICFSQETNFSDIIISIAEELASDDSDPEAVSVFIDKLHELAENPVKINSSNENEISRLFFLSDFQVKALAEYVHSTGQLVSVYELAAIPGFDKETAEMIIPFITLENKLISNSDSVRWRNSMISNFSLKSGNNDTSFLGSAWKILTKYKFTSGDFSGGFTMEKDPGEKLFSGNPPLPDFLSSNITFTGNGLIKKIVIGDYSARFGQGTNINTDLRTGISLTAPGYMSANDEIKPYTSTEENRFFRGVAGEFSIKNLGLTMFFSKNYSDATIASSSGSENDYIENFYLAGVHNTSSLLKKKDAVSESTYGISLSYNINNLRAGLIWSETRLSLPVKLTGNNPEKILDFTGDRNNIYSIYYNYLIKKILLYGELSADENKKFAVVQGMSFRPSDRLTIGILFRNYFSGYTTFYGQGPGTSSKTTNENGVLENFTFEAARHLFISGGCDLQHFPWLKYRCSAPSWAMKQEIKVRFLPSEKLTVDASYNYRLTMADNAETGGIPDQEKLITRSFKVSSRYSLHNNLTLGTQIDYKIANPSGSTGMILFQEISYNFRKVPVTVWARFCLFYTNDWDSRIYTYENDLLDSFSIPALYGKGSRSYIMAKWKIRDFAELRIKYGITSSVTSGRSLENTEEIKMQFRIWF